MICNKRLVGDLMWEDLWPTGIKLLKRKQRVTALSCLTHSSHTQRVLLIILWHSADIIRSLSSFCGRFFCVCLFLFQVAKDESASVWEMSLHGNTSRWRQRISDLCLDWPWCVWKLKPCRNTFRVGLCSGRAVSIHISPIYCMPLPHFPVIGTEENVHWTYTVTNITLPSVFWHKHVPTGPMTQKHWVQMRDLVLSACGSRG